MRSRSCRSVTLTGHRSLSLCSWLVELVRFRGYSSLDEPQRSLRPRSLAFTPRQPSARWFHHAIFTLTTIVLRGDPPAGASRATAVGAARNPRERRRHASGPAPLPAGCPSI